MMGLNFDDVHGINISDRHDGDDQDDDRYNDNKTHITLVIDKTMMMEIALVIDTEP